jgi:two-component system, cell cycle sensor histidine kinase and response regulator CckA
VLTDITAGKPAVEAVRGWEGEFRSLAESSHDYIVLYDKECRHLYMNPAALDCAGLRDGERIGGPSRQSGVFHGFHPDLQEKIGQVFSTTVPFRTEMEWHGSEGRRYFDWRLTPVFDAEGRVCSVLSVSKDISAGKQVEALTLEMESRFRQFRKLEKLGVLAGGLAHEFNNLLGIILGQCDILSENIRCGIDPRVHVKHIEQAAHRAVDVCREIQTCVNHAQVQTRISLRLLVENTVEQFQASLNSTVRLDLDRNDDFETTGDRARIRQAIMNLFDNAVETTGEQQDAITIALSRKIVGEGHAGTDFLGNPIQAGEHACLTVSGNGNDGDVEMRQGRSGVSATPYNGAAFKLFFPLTADAGIASAAPATDISPVKGYRTLLLVDDEAPLRIIGSALLKAMGFAVMIATGGREAVEIQQKNSREIDLIVLDLLMPEMGGVETYRVLRQMSPAVPIVVCKEGDDDGDIPQDFRDDPFAEIVRKPFRPDQLRSIFMKLKEATE